MPDRLQLDGGRFDAKFRAVAPHEMADQFRDVLRALAQGRNLDDHHTQPVVEILAELLFAQGGFQVLAGGWRQSTRQASMGMGSLPPKPVDIFFLQHP